MANINLYQSSQDDARRSRSGVFDTGMVLAFVFALLTLAVFGGVQFYLGSMDQKIVMLQQEKEDGLQELDENEVDAAASFQQRLEKITSGADTFAADDPAKIFENVQQNIVGGIVLSDMGFDGKALTLSMSADSFDVLAGQILKFKESDFFRSVDVDSTSRSSEGKITATLSLKMSE